MGRGGSVYYRMLGIYIIAEPSVATQYSFLLNQTFTEVLQSFVVSVHS